MKHVVIEKDLAGIIPTQPLMDMIKAEVLQAASAGAGEVDIIIRRVQTRGFPNLITDFNGHLLETLAQALRFLQEPKAQEIERALRIVKLWDGMGNAAQREWMSNVIEILNSHRKTFFDEFPIGRLEENGLEQDVIESAIAQRVLEVNPIPRSQVDGGEYSKAVIYTRAAVDALIRAREEGAQTS